MKEKRRHPRVPSTQRCWCVGDAVTVYGPVVNASRGGLFLRTAAPLAPGMATRVRVAGKKGAPVERRATVAWRRAPGGSGEPGPGVGLRFASVTSSPPSTPAISRRGKRRRS